MKNSSKPILVTGAAGFIGSQYVSYCNSIHQSVISVDELSCFQERNEHKGINFGTIIEREKLFEWLNVKKPSLSAIIHMGACSDQSVKNASYLKKMNIDYSKNIWDYATLHKIPFIYASSGATYGSGEIGYDDNEDLIPKLKPLSLYGKSKQEFDLWALKQEQKDSHPPTWCGFKFFNVYGFGERHKNKMSRSTVLHAFVQIGEVGQVKLFKSHRPDIAHGEQKRDFIYVEDVIDVINFAIKKPIHRGIYNLGTGEARTFLDLAKSVFKALNKQDNITFIDTPLHIRDQYQYFTQASMARLREQGYEKPFTSLEEGIKKYIQKLNTFYSNKI
ncbi:MAG: ADP-glyceromanno-heptose 6-epimerase [Deltaproteobacteria bacterium]|nr:ADP-glyceromanno-heptose 6-epimerase [Deltaproteobacteria bacterium]